MPDTSLSTPSAGSAVPTGEPWWKSAVVYQIYPRSFADGNGDGIGDLPGIIARLDHLATLGVDVIWLSPVYPSPQDDAGYDISDYQDIESVFGTLEDFDLLLTQVHARGMKLVMDLVVNHTSDEHPWFAESRGGAKRDWYWWRPPREGATGGEPGAEPNNWVSRFSGSAWQWDPDVGQYYLHLFSRKQPDLNWENPAVRQTVYAMMRWWLDRGVDGFRMDVVNMISKDLALPDGAPLPDAGHIGERPLGDGTPYYICGPRIHEFLAEMHREVFADRLAAGAQLLTVGEMPGTSVEQARLFTDPARAEVDMVFQFEHVGVDREGSKWHPVPLRLAALKASLDRWQQGLADVGWNSLYWDNHDQPRAVSRFGSDDPRWRVLSAKLLGTVLHLHRGTPYVYQGEELGMTNAPFPDLDALRDIESLNRWAVETAAGVSVEDFLARVRISGRDNARTPVQWDASPHAGFSTGVPWIGVNPNFTEINAAAQVEDPHSVFAHYRALIALRHTEPAVALGSFTMLAPDDPLVYAFTRRLADVELLVVANFGADPVELRDRDVLAKPAWADWTAPGAAVLLGNYPESAQPAEFGTLRPWEARVHRRLVTP